MEELHDLVQSWLSECKNEDILFQDIEKMKKNYLLCQNQSNVPTIIQQLYEISKLEGEYPPKNAKEFLSIFSGAFNNVIHIRKDIAYYFLCHSLIETNPELVYDFGALIYINPSCQEFIQGLYFLDFSQMCQKSGEIILNHLLKFHGEQQNFIVLEQLSAHHFSYEAQVYFQYFDLDATTQEQAELIVRAYLQGGNCFKALEYIRKCSSKFDEEKLLKSLLDESLSNKMDDQFLALPFTNKEEEIILSFEFPSQSFSDTFYLMRHMLSRVSSTVLTK